MAVDIIVRDTGPLISLEKMTDGYALMEKLYGQILIPPRVAQDLCQGIFSSWEVYQAHYGFGDFASIVEVPNVKSYPTTRGSGDSFLRFTTLGMTVWEVTIAKRGRCHPVCEATPKE